MEREKDKSKMNCVSKLCLNIVSPRYLFPMRPFSGPFREENLLLILRLIYSLLNKP